jgi:pilus assembly protein CpaE
MNNLDNQAAMHIRKRALFIGRDWTLFQHIESMIRPTFDIVMEQEVPNIWPDDLELVLIEADRDRARTMENITRITSHSRGLAPFLLIHERDVELIMQASRLGVRSFIEVPEDLPNILGIVQKVNRNVSGRGGAISSFFSLKGGVGCTMLAVNVAHHLRDITVGRTVLVDLNVPLGDTALYMDIADEGAYSIADFIYNMGRFDEKLVYESLTRHRSGVYLLGLPKRLEDLENLTPEAVQASLQTLRRYYDHIIIDCASDLSATTLSCLDESDQIVLVTEPSLASLRATRTVYDLSRELGYAPERLRLVLNRHTAAGEELVDELIGALGLPVAARVANSYYTFLESLKHGELLHEYAPGSQPDQQIRAIAEMLHQGMPRASTEITVAPPRLVDRLLGRFHLGKHVGVTS